MSRSLLNLVDEDQYEPIKEEIAQSRAYLLQTNAQHELRIKDIRVSYEMKLQQVKNQGEIEIKQLQDRIWELKHSLDQEKQIQITRSHRFAVSKLEYSEAIENLEMKKKGLEKKFVEIEEEDVKRHSATVSALKNEFDQLGKQIRNEKRRCEECIAEESYQVRCALEERKLKFSQLEEEKISLREELSKLKQNNDGKMVKIEESLKISQKEIESHEEKLNKVMKSGRDKLSSDLSEIIQTKEEMLAKCKEKNSKLHDSQQKLEKILYGKLPIAGHN